MAAKKSILIIYTGGTIGMVKDEATGALKPFDFERLLQEVPELDKFDLDLDLHHLSFTQPIDSSNMHPEQWAHIAQLIQANYEKHNGFVILHGSDTMAYTASALSFMLEGLEKPVILTGSQLPIDMIRTDARENLVTAIAIAADTYHNRGVDEAMVQEVAVYFEYSLYRGNRTHKNSSEDFEAFTSPNHPSLAEAGVHLKYNQSALWRPLRKLDGSTDGLAIHTEMDIRVASLKLFPGLHHEVIEAILSIPNLQGLVLETFGSGNGPTAQWFEDCLKAAADAGVVIVNISQCQSGTVQQGKYEASTPMVNAGVISGSDLTFEAAVTKLMYLLGRYKSREDVKRYFKTPLRGEMAG